MEFSTHPNLQVEGPQGAAGGQAVKRGREQEAGQHYQNYAVQAGGVRKLAYMERGRDPAIPLGTPPHTCQ